MANIPALRFFWPESVLTVAVLAMLVQDLIVRRSKRRVPALVVGALFWLALTAAATWATPSTTTPLFGGLLQHDPLRLFFAWLFLAAAFLTVIIVPKSAQISPARLGEFIALLFALVLGMFLMASATDLLMIYLAVETVSLVSYVLTSCRRADPVPRLPVRRSPAGGPRRGHPLLLRGVPAAAARRRIRADHRSALAGDHRHHLRDHDEAREPDRDRAVQPAAHAGVQLDRP